MKGTVVLGKRRLSQWFRWWNDKKQKVGGEESIYGGGSDLYFSHFSRYSLPSAFLRAPL